MNIAEIKTLVRALPKSIPVFLWGRPGIGKSQCVMQLAKEEGVGFKDVRLTTLDPTDLRGLPVINHESKLVIWYPPALLPQPGKDPDEGYLMLDELNAAHPTIQAAAYQLVLDKAIGDYKLPAGWRIVAAGNREEDRGVTFTMPRPLQNRFMHITAEVDNEVWVEWGTTHGLSPMVLAFIMNNPGMLCPPDKDYSKNAFPTPRTWEYTSEIVKSIDDDKMLIPAIGNTIGDAAGAQFMTFIRLRHELPDIGRILNGEELKLPTKPDVQYAFYGSFCGKIDSLIAHTKGGSQAIAKNEGFVNGLIYITKGLPREFGELIIRYIAQRHGELFVHMVRNSTKFTKEFASIYKEFMAIAARFGGRTK